MGGSAFGVILMVIILGVMFFIFIPLMIRHTRKQVKSSRTYMPELLRRSGLSKSSNGLFGRYKGFNTKVKMGIGYNYAKIGSQVLSGGTSTSYRGAHTASQTIHVEMTLDKDVTPIILKEKVGVLRTDEFINEKIKGQSINLPEIKELKGILKRVRVYCEDKQFAERIVNDTLLQQLLSDWYFTDVVVTGNKVYFTLDDVMTTPKFGNRLMKPDHVLQAMNITARVAELVSA